MMEEAAQHQSSSSLSEGLDAGAAQDFCALPERNEHVVLPSDTFMGLCLKYGVSGRALRKANKLEGDNVQSREVLLIPPPTNGRPAPRQEQTRDVAAQRLRNATR